MTARALGVRLLLGGCVTAAALVPAHRALEGRQHARTSWTRVDADGDGVPLSEDRDPDGDGLDALVDPDSDGDSLPDVPDAVEAAKAMLGRPSDPLMGRLGDPLGRIGFVVCTDVVVEAWLRAGRSLPRLLRDAAAEHPEFFERAEDNFPSDPYFARRVRNYADLFGKAAGFETDAQARPGDLAFFGRAHVALVSEVGTRGWRVVEAYGPLVAERDLVEVERRTGARARFGRLAGR